MSRRRRKNTKEKTEMTTEYLTREQIEQADDIEIREIEIPEWGNKKVRIRAMTGTERDEYDNILAKHTVGEPPNHTTDMRGIRAEVVALCMVDELNVRIFQDATILTAKSGSALSRIYDVAMEISGVFAESRRGLEKNLGLGQSVSSGSSSADKSEGVL